MRKALTWAAVCSLAAPLATFAAAGDWPQWRGPEGTGVAPEGRPPVTWSEKENVRWKVAIPGRGHASPIVWGDRVFLLTAAPTGEQTPPPEPPPGADERTRRRFARAVHPTQQSFLVMALSRKDGSVMWQKTAAEAVPSGTTHRDATWASASPVTDGVTLFAQFGSQGLFAYRLDGTLLWQRDLGDMRTRNGFGEGSSPVIVDDKVIIVWDHEDDSFIVALDRRTGKDVWRKSREEPTSWATPLAVEVGDRTQIVVPGSSASRGYDAMTGDVVWQSSGMTLNVVPTPVYGHGMAYLMSGFRGAALQAVKLAAAKGEIDGTEAMVWTHDRDTPYVPSSLLYDDKLYFLKSNDGILSVLDAKTGEAVYGPQRLDGVSNIYASPVGAAGRVYLAGREGTTLVLEHGAELKILASNTLDEGTDASPAIAGSDLYLRGTEHLYCLAEGGSDGAKAEAKSR